MPRWHPVSISRLPHPRGRLDRGPGAGVHARQRLRLRRGGAGGRPRRRRVRAAPVVLLQRPHRLLRGDRQVPRRPAHLGPLDARPLRRDGRAQPAAAASTPRPPGVSLTAQQPEINIARVAVAGARRRPWRAPRACTPTLRRGARAADREGRPDRAAHPADRRPRDRRGQRRRSARRLGVRRVDDRRDGAPGRGDLRAPARDRATGRSSRAPTTGIENGWFVGQIADAAYRFERKVNAGRRIVVGVNAFTDGDEDVAGDTLYDRPRGRGVPAQAPGQREERAGRPRLSPPRWTRSAPARPTPTGTSCRR